jgi:hypothetical protein
VDTRSKIISLDRACGLLQDPASGPVKVVAGNFDVLTAGLLRRLQSLADGNSILIAAVVDPPDPVLPARARAELVSALAVVDYVILTQSADLALLGGIINEEAADRKRLESLIEHVHRRQTA